MSNYTGCVEVSVFPKYKIVENRQRGQLIFAIDCIVPIVRNLEVHNIYVHKKALGNHDHFSNPRTIEYMEKEFLLEVEKIQKFYTTDKRMLEQSTWDYYWRHIND